MGWGSDDVWCANGFPPVLGGGGEGEGGRGSGRMDVHGWGSSTHLQIPTTGRKTCTWNSGLSALPNGYLPMEITMLYYFYYSSLNVCSVGDSLSPLSPTFSTPIWEASVIQCNSFSVVTVAFVSQ